MNVTSIVDSQISACVYVIKQFADLGENLTFKSVLIMYPDGWSSPNIRPERFAAMCCYYKNHRNISTWD